MELNVNRESSTYAASLKQSAQLMEEECVKYHNAIASLHSSWDDSDYDDIMLASVEIKRMASEIVAKADLLEKRISEKQDLLQKYDNIVLK
ncbi:MAG: hypothetical protein ACI4MI_02855 [Christensenellales bacterium]